MKYFLGITSFASVLGIFASAGIASADSKKPFPFSKAEVEAFVDFQCHG